MEVEPGVGAAQHDTAASTSTAIAGAARPISVFINVSSTPYIKMFQFNK
jgi:hypothetical protein